MPVPVPKPGDWVRLHPASDLYARGALRGRVTSVRGEIIYINLGLAWRATDRRQRVHRSDLLLES